MSDGDGRGTFAVIGDTCDNGSCTAPWRVRAVFVYGELWLCRHHWLEAEELIVATATYLHACDQEMAEAAAQAAEPVADQVSPNLSRTR